MTDVELVHAGKNPKDPGGYFIMGGLEIHIMYEEKLAINKFFLTTNRTAR